MPKQHKSRYKNGGFGISSFLNVIPVIGMLAVIICGWHTNHQEQRVTLCANAYMRLTATAQKRSLLRSFRFLYHTKTPALPSGRFCFL